MKKNGFNLLEMMLALLVLVAVTLMAVKTYRKTHFAHNIIALNGSVSLLQDSLNRYFMANCGTLSRATQGQSVSIERDLIPHYLKNLQLIKNPFYFSHGENAFATEIRWSDEKQNWHLMVEASFPEFMPTSQLRVIAGETNPSIIMPDDQKMLVWQSTPSADSLGLDAGNSPLSDDLEQFAREQYAQRDPNGPGVDEQGKTYPCAILDRQYLQQLKRGETQ